MQADPLAAVAALPGVDEAVERSRVAVDRLRGHKVLRSRSAQVTAESALRGARASAALAGADWPLEELRRRTDLGDEPGAAAVRGALRISGELGELLPILRQAPAQALTRMHLLAAAGEVEATRIGRPRLDGEPVTAEPAMPQEPVDAQQAAARLTALARVGSRVRNSSRCASVSRSSTAQALGVRPSSTRRRSRGDSVLVTRPASTMLSSPSRLGLS